MDSLLKRSKNLANKITQIKSENKETLNENKNIGDNVSNKTVIVLLSTVLEKLSKIEKILDESKVVQTSDGSVVQILIGKTHLKGSMTQVK